MVLADDRILEYIRANGPAGSTEMEESGYVRKAQSTISRRCKKLEEKGLLRHIGNGLYSITERGEKYLDGEIDTSEDAPDEVNSSMREMFEQGENHNQA